ncbi:MAG: sulfotransferase family protein [Pseudomonadota bacterium]
MRTKVFGIGFNKTGTTSLAEALKILGYRHKSFDDALLEAYSSGDTQAVIDSAVEYDSFEDWPWPLAYRELDEAFPTAKFILTTRTDSGVWFESLRKHAVRTGPTQARHLVFGDSQVGDSNKERLIQMYQEHNQGVRAHFVTRSQQLLELCWESGHGWEELCEFLNEPVPDVRFPWRNKSPERKTSTRRRRWFGRIR